MLTVAAALFTAVLISPAPLAQSRLTALPQRAPAPRENPTTPERVALGRLLFWDPVLSGQKDVACGTCHHPSHGYSDGLAVSIGVNGVGLAPSRTFAHGVAGPLVKRNSQTVLNVAFNGLRVDAAPDASSAPMFWDLRVRGLEAQALEPIKALEEMRGTVYTEQRATAVVVSRLKAISEYRQLFERAFGPRQPVTEENLGKALAAFQRTLLAVNAPFDRYVRGETGAMSAEQLRGMERFESAGCANCHSGPMFSDFGTHVLGVPDNAALPSPDTGVSKTFAFRTPSLRNLGVTGPYMHNGAFSSLPDVLAFYRRLSGGGGRGGRGADDGGNRRRTAPNRGLNTLVARNQIDPLARRLRLRGGAQREILAFLRALDDPDFDRTIPSRVPSGLPVGGRIVP